MILTLMLGTVLEHNLVISVPIYVTHCNLNSISYPFRSSYTFSQLLKRKVIPHRRYSLSIRTPVKCVGNLDLLLKFYLDNIESFQLGLRDVKRINFSDVPHKNVEVLKSSSSSELRTCQMNSIGIVFFYFSIFLIRDIPNQKVYC